MSKDETREQSPDGAPALAPDITDDGDVSDVTAHSAAGPQARSWQEKGDGLIDSRDLDELTIKWSRVHGPGVLPGAPNPGCGSPESADSPPSGNQCSRKPLSPQATVPQATVPQGTVPSAGVSRVTGGALAAIPCARLPPRQEYSIREKFRSRLHGSLFFMSAARQPPRGLARAARSTVHPRYVRVSYRARGMLTSAPAGGRSPRHGPAFNCPRAAAFLPLPLCQIVILTRRCTCWARWQIRRYVIPGGWH